MKNKYKYAVFILTRGRPNNQKTFDTLVKCGYSGKVFFIVDSDDKTVEEYINNYGKQSVIVIDKSEMWDRTDTYINKKTLGAVIFPRNKSIDIANEMNLDFVVLCDDDISDMNVCLIKNNKLAHYHISRMDDIFKLMFDFYNTTNTHILGFCESYLYYGGANSVIKNGMVYRNSHLMIVNPKKLVQWSGLYFEDNISALHNNKVGNLVWSACNVSLSAVDTKLTNKGGMTETYQGNNVYYVPWFMVLMDNPDCVQLVWKGKNGFKIIRKSNNIIPKILNEKYRKL